MVLTEVFIRNLDALLRQPRYIVNEGGSGSSKTVSQIQLAIHIIERFDPGSSFSIVSESLPHLKKGAIRDFKQIMADAWDEKAWNATEHTYKFAGGGFLEFFSGEPGKGTGPRRDYLFINEAINVQWEVAKQLKMRTNKVVFIDYNPRSEFWVHTEILPPPYGLATHGEKTEYIHSTYSDAVDHVTGESVLPPAIIRELLNLKGNDRTVYLEGKLGSLVGLIYNFDIVPHVPDGAELFAYGVDQGFSTDPTAVCALYRWNGGVVVDELFYATGMMPEDVWNGKDEMEGIRDAVDLSIDAYADSNRPIYIEGFRRAGWRRIKPASKPKDSVLAGIQLVQHNPLWFTARSLNFIKDARNYRWKVDKQTGKPLNEPEHKWSHGCDALRYPLQTIFAKPKFIRTLVR